MKKLASVVLSLCMLLTVIALPIASADEAPTVITWLHEAYDVGGLDNWYDALWVKELESRLNIDLQFVDLSSAVNTLDTIANLTIASGDWPHLITWDWTKYSGGLDLAIEDGLVVPVSQHEEYISLVPNYLELVNSNDIIRRALTLSDGTLAAFPHIEESTARQAYSGYTIRKDWLNRVGLEVPTTVEELYTVLCAFRDQDANGNGDASDELPMSDRSTLNLIKELAAAWGLIYNTMQFDPNTGEVTYWTQVNGGANFKDFALTMHKWYAEGLIDPEFTTNAQTEINSKVTSDVLGFFHSNTNRFPSYYAVLETVVSDPSAVELQGMQRLAYQNNSEKHFTAATNVKNWCATAESTIITTTAIKDGVIEKVLELINYMYSEEGLLLINWGVEGVSFVYDENGSPVWTDAVKNADTSLSSDKIVEFAIPTRGGFPKIMSLDAWMSMDANSAEGKTALELNYSADKDLVIGDILLTGADSEEYTNIMADVNTAVAETFLSVIVGNKSEADIDKLFATVKGMGIDRAIEIYATTYEAYLGR